MARKQQEIDNKQFLAVQGGSWLIILLCGFLRLIMGLADPTQTRNHEKK